MPFKHNAVRRRGIPKARYRVRSWPAYEAAIARWRKVVGVPQAAETLEQEAAAS